MSDSERVLIYRCPNGLGLGAMFVLIAGYAAYCARHGLSLALDTERCQYFSHDRHRAFFECFRIDGGDSLDVIVDPEQIAALSAHSERIAVDRYALSPEIAPTGNILDLEAGAMNRRIAPWYGVAPPPGFAIRPAGWLKSRIDQALGTRDWSDVLGIHFRHGNGELLESREDFLTTTDYPNRVLQFQEKMAGRILSKAVGRPVLVTGDNRDFVAFMLARIPGAFTLGMPPPDKPYIEYLHAVGPERALVEAAVDLWGLASCRDIICGHSSFSEAALVLNPAMNIEAVEDLKLGDGTNSQSAVLHARIALLIQPMRALSWTNLSRALRAASDEHAAGACLRIAAAIDEGEISPEAANARLLDTARLDLAVEHWKASLRGGDYEAHAVRQMARILAKAGFLEMAVSLIRSFTTNVPGDAALQGTLAMLLERYGDVERAIAETQKWVALAPRNPSSHALLAKLLHRANSPDAKEAMIVAARLIKESGTRDE